MLKRSTIQLLRFPFSIFLMPVYWFALSSIQHINIVHAIFMFIVLHVLLYPSSNGYNSYMDRDTESIGGLSKPMQPEKQLFFVTVVMDIACLVTAFFISPLTALLLFIYIFFSRMYSYRGIRLKRYAIAGYITVIINQGALMFIAVFLACNKDVNAVVPWNLAVVACLLIGGFYPITQVYQHKADADDGVDTISMKLGITGTFIFCACLYAFAFTLLYFSYYPNNLSNFYVLQLFFIPVIIYFVVWFLKLLKDKSFADFKHTMRMNWIASVCSNLAFITLLIKQHS